MRAAALPVGAASAMRQSGSSASRQASRLTTVVVLPVPGPPLITVSRPRSASAAASCCQSARAAEAGGVGGEQLGQPRAQRGRRDAPRRAPA